MLAMADKRGRVWGSVPGLANIARVTVEEARAAILKLNSPDIESRTKVQEGRRILPIDGGWRLVNYDKYRAIRDEEERRAYKTEKQREYRSVDNVDRSGPLCTGVDSGGHNAEAEAEAEEYKESSLRSPKKASAAKAARPAPTLEAIVSELQAMPAYTTLNVKHEADKCVAWWSVKGRSVNKRMVLNWLNRADAPLLNGHSPPRDRKAEENEHFVRIMQREGMLPK